MIDPDSVVEVRRALGRELAAYRRAAGLSQHELAAAVHYGRSSIANVETGRQNVSREFWQQCDHLVSANGALVHAYDALRTRENPTLSGTSAGTAELDCSARQHEQDFIAALAARPTAACPPGLATAITGYEAATPPSHDLDLPALSTAVVTAKRRYQSCQYAALTDHLPMLLQALRCARQQVDGDEARRIEALTADAFQVTGSVLLKMGEVTMAVLAADRSMTAATQSDDPVTVATSARVVTHSLMSSGHLRQATRLAESQAARLDDAGPPTTQSLSVYGALLLRGALAAARNDDRTTAHHMLDEAAAAADHLGSDANERWTAFGPTNVILHRVNVAVTLGDAGQAVDHARQVNLGQVSLAERRACLFVDIARAFTQWGKPARALRALLAAEHAAPEELRTRPALRRLVADVAQTAPPTLRADAQQLADRVGVNR